MLKGKVLLSTIFFMSGIGLKGMEGQIPCKTNEGRGILKIVQKGVLAQVKEDKHRKLFDDLLTRVEQPFSQLIFSIQEYDTSNEETVKNFKRQVEILSRELDYYSSATSLDYYGGRDHDYSFHFIASSIEDFLKKEFMMKSTPFSVVSNLFSVKD